MRGNVSVIYEPITLDIGDGSEANILHSLNAQLSADDHKNAFHYKGAYERATYLEGDFTVAHEQASSLVIQVPSKLFDTIYLQKK